MKKCFGFAAVLATSLIFFAACSSPAGGSDGSSNVYDPNAPTYTVTFDTNGGKPAAIESQMVQSGKKATKPTTDPTKSGRTFGGWLLNGVEFDFNTPIMQNIALTAKWYYGSKKPSATKAVDDIVFSDGSATTYKAGLTLDDTQKKAAVAVIYKVDGEKSYGVGLVHSKQGLVWCRDDYAPECIAYSSEKAYYKAIDAIKCSTSCTSVATSVTPITFTGDTDGSDNVARLKEALGTTNDSRITAQYPAFEFAMNYKNKKLDSDSTSRVAGTSYENGWYMPSIAELVDVWRKRNDIDSASKLCGGNTFVENMYNPNKTYWSSSEGGDGMIWEYNLIFNDLGDIRARERSVDLYVCVIRQF